MDDADVEMNDTIDLHCKENAVYDSCNLIDNFNSHQIKRAPINKPVQARKVPLTQRLSKYDLTVENEKLSQELLNSQYEFNSATLFIEQLKQELEGKNELLKEISTL